MSQATEFFSDLKEWSTRKLDIIRNYVDSFSKILGSKYQEMSYIDGFAGRGVYENNEKGSPVLIAELAQAFRQQHRSYTLRCFNIEKITANFSNLAMETQRFGNLVRNYHGAFEDHVDNVLLATDGNPAIFFLDDFGVKGTSWAAVEKVARRKGPTDIWIRFDHRTALRLLGFSDSPAKEAAGKMQTVQSLYGLPDIRQLKALLMKAPDAAARVRIAVDVYLEQLEQVLRSQGKQTGFASAYPIHSLNGERKYHLVFACTHPKAAILANNIVNIVEEQFQREKEEYREGQTGQSSLFPLEITEGQIKDQKVRGLKKGLLALTKNKDMSREELHFEYLVQNKSQFGRVGATHFTRALKEVLADYPLKIKASGSVSNENTTFTLIE